LGDRVLGLVISQKLLDLYPDEQVGKLDKRFAFLVNKQTCLKIAKSLKIKNFFILGKTYKNKKKIEDRLLSDLIEALIGAIYLDLGFLTAKKFILDLWKDYFNVANNSLVDSKTKLQEYSLNLYKKLPIYKLVKSYGPRHKPIYKVGVKIFNSKQHVGTGKSIKLAEQNAAKSLLNDLKK